MLRCFLKILIIITTKPRINLAKRLTEKQKEEIIKCFEEGKNIDLLSQEFDCTRLTVIRNLKKNLGEIKYKELLNKSKPLKIKPRKNNNQTTDSPETYFYKKEFNKDFDDSKVLNENITSSNFAPIDSFLEIAPIEYEMDNKSRKELSSVSISEVNFPKVVYMIVHKKIELEIKLLKDFPEWDFY